MSSRWNENKSSSQRPVSRLNQPSVKKKKEVINENVKIISPSSVRVELKNLSSEDKIDKLDRDCKRLQCLSDGLKRTIQTLRRSICKCVLKGGDP